MFVSEFYKPAIAMQAHGLLLELAVLDGRWVCFLAVAPLGSVSPVALSHGVISP